MDRWTREFASWDVCDTCCSNLFDRTPYAWQKIRKWAEGDGEYVRRAAFVTSPDGLPRTLSVNCHRGAQPGFKTLHGGGRKADGANFEGLCARDWMLGTAVGAAEPVPTGISAS